MTRRRSAALLLVLGLLALAAAPLSPASATSHSTPVGRIDRFRQVPTGIEVAGWVVDEDTSAPVLVHLYVNGAVVGAVWADETRNDIGAKYPALGADHGFSTIVPVTTTPATVCAYAINRPSGTNPRLGCSTFDQSPTGRLDAVSRRPGGDLSTVHVEGWAVDPDRQWGIAVHLYSNGVLVGSALANESRPDIAAQLPAYGDRHGFSADLLLPAGSQRVCAYAIDVGPGANRLLGCSSTTVTTLPFGVLDSVGRSGGDLTVSGWTIDPDTIGPTTVEVRVNGALAGTLPADVVRTTLGLYGLVYGTTHGFSGTVGAIGPTPALVCVHAANVHLGSGTRLLGCRVV